MNNLNIKGLERVISFGLALVTLGTITSGAKKINYKPNESDLKYYSSKETINITSGVNLYIDDKPFTPKDEKGNVIDPFIYNGSTYLPIRAILGAYDLNFEWDSTTQTVNIITSKLVLNNKESVVTNKTKETKNVEVISNININIDNKPFIPTDINGKVVNVYLINGTVMLPIRSLLKHFNINIEWEGNTNSVYIGKHVKTINTGKNILPGDPNYKAPTENDSQEALVKRFISLFEEWNTYRDLIDPLQRCIGQTTHPYLDYALLYQKYADEGSEIGKKYVQRDDQIRVDLGKISDTLAYHFDDSVMYQYHQMFTGHYNGLKNNINYYDKRTLVNLIEGLSSVVVGIKEDVDQFNPTVQAKFKKRFEDLYKEFLLEIANEPNYNGKQLTKNIKTTCK